MRSVRREGLYLLNPISLFEFSQDHLERRREGFLIEQHRFFRLV